MGTLLATPGRMEIDLRLEAGAATHPGRRRLNEDGFCIAPDLGLYAVADGAGCCLGHTAGSTTGLEELQRFLVENRLDPERTWPCNGRPSHGYAADLLAAGFRRAHQAVRRRRAGDLLYLASTLSVLFHQDGSWVLGHVGDSRVYQLRGERLCQLTCDHSLLEDMRRAGLEVDPGGWPKYVVTRALGMGGPDPEVVRLRPAPGDRFLLCSDGLHDVVPEPRVAELLSVHPPPKAAAALVEEALGAGATDNVTAVVLRVSPGALRSRRTT